MLEFIAGAGVALVVAFIAHWLAGRRALVGWRHEQASQAATDLIRASSRLAFYRREGVNLHEAVAEMYVADTVVRAHFSSEAAGMASSLADKAVSAAEARNGEDRQDIAQAQQVYFNEVDAFISCTNKELGLSGLAPAPRRSKSVGLG